MLELGNNLLTPWVVKSIESLGHRKRFGKGVEIRSALGERVEVNFLQIFCISLQKKKTH